MNMDSGPPPINQLWKALEEHKETLETFGNEADAWLEGHPTIRARIDLLTANKQTEENAEAILAYIKSEAHPAALFTLHMVRDLSRVPNLQLESAFGFVRTVFAAGYQQALRDAMEEEIIV